MTKEERREYKRKRYAEHREERKIRMRKWREGHREEYNDFMKKYQAKELNQYGKTKNSIRGLSNKILKSVHSKLSGYEIHHCFGYEDPDKFIYIPKSLHAKIHQLLRDKKIPADSDHWFAIRDLVNSCEEYTYIRA